MYDINNKIISEKWEQILHTVKSEERLVDVSYKTWIAPLEFGGIQDNVVIIRYPMSSVCDFLKERYGKTFKYVIASLTGVDYEIDFRQ